MPKNYPKPQVYFQKAKTAGKYIKSRSFPSSMQNLPPFKIYLNTWSKSLLEKSPYHM